LIVLIVCSIIIILGASRSWDARHFGLYVISA
jgi:hypothetical protein